MPKYLDDTLERLLELAVQSGQKTKTAAKAVGQKVAGDLTGNYARPENSRGKNEKNYTPLTAEKIAQFDRTNQHHQEDEVKKRLLRNFFDRYKEDEKKTIEALDAAEQKRRQKPLVEPEQKNGGEKLAPVAPPKGKKRRSFLQQVVKASQPETRGASGKF